jgi:DNA-binding MarR family transcriptional regulator
MIDHPEFDGDLVPLAPLLRLGWQHARRRIYEGLRQAGYEDLAQADLAVFQFPTPDGARPTELAAGALMTKQALNRLLRHLEHRGYLRLEPLSSDQRARVVRLSKRGEQVLATIRELHADIEAEWTDRIGQRRFAALRNAMTDLTAEISSRPGPGPQRPRRVPAPARQGREWA